MNEKDKVETDEPYYLKPLNKLISELDTNTEHGLSKSEASSRLLQYGKNELTSATTTKWYQILIRQLMNFLSMILVIFMCLCFIKYIEAFVEGIVLLLIIISNVVIGYYMENKSEKTMDSLRRLSSPTSKLIRGGEVQVIATNELVPGDLLIIETGMVIGADARILDQFNLAVDEALLTGESMPSEKSLTIAAEIVAEGNDVAVDDRANCLFSSTTVTKGRGKAVVIGTGLNTEIGKIALSLNSSAGSKTKTTLQKGLDKMALYIFLFSMILFVLVMVIHYWYQTKKWDLEKNSPKASNEEAYNSLIYEGLKYGIALSVAIVPESLIAVVTLTMSMGVWRMAKNKAIVRQIAALEAIGAVTDICSDKTGTLTQAKMVLTNFFVPMKGYFKVTGLGYEPIGEVIGVENEQFDKDELNPDFLRCSALCNTAQLKFNQEAQLWHGFGDPTEIALQTFAHKVQMSQPSLVELGWELKGEFAFDSTVKKMSVIYKSPENGLVVYCKGAMEQVLISCTRIQEDEVREITSSELDSLLSPKMQELASKGLRTLCLAYKPIPHMFHERQDVEAQLIFLALVGIYDPPRPESRDSVLQCHKAGIRVHMLTGDHPATAFAIAKDVAIIPSDYELNNSVNQGNRIDEKTTIPVEEKFKMVMTAREFDNLTNEQIDSLVELPYVIARCSPDTKVKMIQALHRRQRIAVMTGDGVNDSPSLKIADIGVGMGLSGSDVAKQASDIILTDDNFATIVMAVSEGRRIFTNILKFILHLMSGNISEVIVLVFGLGVNVSNTIIYPLSPVSIMVLNMVTSSFPAIALGCEQPTKDSMRKRPIKGKDGIFSKEIIIDMLFYGSLIGLLTLIGFFISPHYYKHKPENSPMDDILPNPNNTANNNIDFSGFSFFGPGKDRLTNFCNSYATHHNVKLKNCIVINEARAVAYIIMTQLILIHAFNCKNFRKSIWFSLRNLRSLINNPFLFLSVFLGALLPIPVIYIDWFAIKFEVSPIGWLEWGFVAFVIVLFVLCSEFYKFIKRKVMPSHSFYVQITE